VRAGVAGRASPGQAAWPADALRTQNTNYVLNVARGRRERGGPTGEAETMRDRIKGLQMGDRAGRQVPKALKEQAL